MCIRDSLKSFLKEVTDSNGEIILFIDELHTIVGAGAGLSLIHISHVVHYMSSPGKVLRVASN